MHLQQILVPRLGANNLLTDNMRSFQTYQELLLDHGW